MTAPGVGSDPAKSKPISPGEVTTPIGAIIVTYGSADVIGACLDSLYNSEDVDLRIVVVDNASPDDTVECVRTWASGRDVDLAEVVPDLAATNTPSRCGSVTLLKSQANLGYAGGVNLGIEALLSDPRVGLFWIVNPDCSVTPGAAAAFIRAASVIGDFSLMGGRVLYTEPPNKIQSDGGRVSRSTGVCHSVNQGLSPSQVSAPDASSLDFISGANLVASRNFVERAGLMRDDYFLYYEEVDWAFRCGDLPLAICEGAIVYHEGGTSIGSGSITRRASAFANYFNYRSRMRFLWRFNRRALPGAYAYALAKTVQMLLLREGAAAFAILAGTHHLPPPAGVRKRLSGTANEAVPRS